MGAEDMKRQRLNVIRMEMLARRSCPRSRSCAWASVPTTCPTSARPVNVPNRSASPSAVRVDEFAPKRHRGGNPRGEPRRKRARLPVVPAAAVVRGRVARVRAARSEEGYRRHHAGIAGLGVHRRPRRAHPPATAPRAFSCSIITRCRSRASTSWWWDAASSWASPCP